VCPNCGAPVEFASAASVSAVCSFCRSTLLRQGDALKRIGECSELFEDHSPLQLGVRGQYQNIGFTLVGRLQYAYDGGTWNEWFALFERPDGRQKPAWLSEDNGAYVLAFEQPTPTEFPKPEALTPGFRRSVNRGMWSVASVEKVRLQAAQGELPRPPKLQGEFIVADLRSEAGEVGTLDYSNPAAPGWAVGKSVSFKQLALSGLREGEAEKTLAARTLECPSCGSSLTPKLSNTKTISCPSCKAVVDISAGAGAELAHFQQLNQGDEPDAVAEPQIPLGRSGLLALEPGKPAQPWQVVGYQERCNLPGAEDDEQTFWREYLLYNRHLGFIFLVDTDEGWSWARPLTGAPKLNNREVNWSGRRYRQRWMYRAKVTWVQGEFYWRVQREETAMVTDYVGPKGWQLSREQTRSEVTWSEGCQLKAEDVGQAFRLTGPQLAALRRKPATLGAWAWIKRLLIGLVLLLVVVALFKRCSGNECDPQLKAFGPDSLEYRDCQRQLAARSGSYGSGGYGGGSYGGSGGGHK
jgi:hypothetical protein